MNDRLMNRTTLAMQSASDEQLKIDNLIQTTFICLLSETTVLPECFGISQLFTLAARVSGLLLLVACISQCPSALKSDWKTYKCCYPHSPSGRRSLVFVYFL